MDWKNFEWCIEENLSDGLKDSVGLKDWMMDCRTEWWIDRLSDELKDWVMDCKTVMDWRIKLWIEGLSDGLKDWVMDFRTKWWIDRLSDELKD